MRATIGAILALALTISGSTSAKTYRIDSQHTSVAFQVKYLFTNVEGRFDAFEGVIEFDPERPNSTKVSGTIQAASIDTGVEKRDKHLREPDFFSVAEYPTITFESTKVTEADVAKGTAKLHGNLTMKGVTKEVVLDVTYLGEAADAWGNNKGGFAAMTTINRGDFGLKWNQALEAGGLLVGEEVRIRIDAQTDVE